MKKIKILLMTLALGLLVLVGCTNEAEMPSFLLNELGTISLEDTETPIRYDINQNRAQDQVIISRNEEVSPYNFSRSEEIYDLEDVTVTEEEIIIEYEGQVETFIRLSESVVEAANKVRYQYIGLMPE